MSCRCGWSDAPLEIVPDDPAALGAIIEELGARAAAPGDPAREAIALPLLPAFAEDDHLLIRSEARHYLAECGCL